MLTYHSGSSAAVAIGLVVRLLLMVYKHVAVVTLVPRL